MTVPRRHEATDRAEISDVGPDERDRGRARGAGAGALAAQRWAAGLWAVLCTTLYAVISLLRYRRVETASWDNAIFTQAVRSYAGLGPPIVDIKGPGYNLLGDHFSPVLALLAPVYRLFPDARTLLIAQAVLLGLSVAVITALALRTLGWWAGGALALGYGLSFGLLSAVEADFHAVAFGAPLLALAGAAFVDRRWGRVMVWSLPLLLVKEDLGLTVAMAGVALWLLGQRRRGTVLTVAGVVAAALVLLVLIPAANPDGTYAYASAVGGDRGLVETVLDQPGRKLATVVMTLAVGGLVAVASPWVLLVLPTFGWRFAGDNPYYWGIDWHYSLLLMPIVVVAAIDVLRRHPRWRPAALIAAVTSLVLLIGSPVTPLTDPETYRVPARAEAAEQILAQIPAGARVETDIALISRLAADREVYWIGTIDDPAPGGGMVPEYVVVETDGGLGSPTDVVGYAETAHGGDYRLLDSQAGFALARRLP